METLTSCLESMKIITNSFEWKHSWLVKKEMETFTTCLEWNRNNHNYYGMNGTIYN